MSILGRFLPGFDRSFFWEELRFTDLLRPKSVAGKAVINFTDKKKLKDRVLDSPYGSRYHLYIYIYVCGYARLKYHIP
jgi:hypothetical protein